MKNLKIAICDDIPIVTSSIENYLLEYTSDSFTIDCDIFNQSERLINNLNNSHYDIYILDVEIPTINGLQLAKLIRSTDVHAFIIFCTYYTQYMKDVFEVNTFDYLIKPVTKEKLFKTIDRITDLLDSEEEEFYYKKRNEVVLVPFKNIIYFEKKGRYVLIHTENGADEFIMSTNDLLKKLNDSFVQIHTSFIINLKSLIRLSGENVILKFSNHELQNHQILPISRKFRSYARTEILRYMERKF